MNIKKHKATGVKKVIKKPSKKVAIAKGKKVTPKKLSASFKADLALVLLGIG